MLTLKRIWECSYEMDDECIIGDLRPEEKEARLSLDIEMFESCLDCFIVLFLLKVVTTPKSKTWTFTAFSRPFQHDSLFLMVVADCGSCWQSELSLLKCHKK